MEKLRYFIDPYRVIDKYTSCRINQSKSHLDLESLSLLSVYQFLFEEPLEGAHNALVDVKAQTSIIAHPLFVLFLNRTNSVQLITQIFTTTQTNDFKRRMEPFHPVHAPWVELTEANEDITWEPNPNDSYTSSQGGPKHGPSNYCLSDTLPGNDISCNSSSRFIQHRKQTNTQLLPRGMGMGCGNCAEG
jgi:hypothetical protein